MTWEKVEHYSYLECFIHIFFLNDRTRAKEEETENTFLPTLHHCHPGTLLRVGIFWKWLAFFIFIYWTLDTVPTPPERPQERPQEPHPTGNPTEELSSDKFSMVYL